MVVNFYLFQLNGNYIQISCFNYDEDSDDRTLLRVVFIPLTSRIITDVTEVEGKLMVNNLMLLLENSALISINRFSEEILRDGTLVSDMEPQKTGQGMAMFEWEKEKVDFDEVINRMALATGVTMVASKPQPTDPLIKA